MGLMLCTSSQRKTFIFAMIVNIAMSYRKFLQWYKVKGKDPKLFLRSDSNTL